jgi:hypothetical protein
MTAAAVVMAPPAALGGQHIVDRPQEIVVAPCAGFDDSEACGRVRDEDRDEAVPTIGAEAGHQIGDVDDDGQITRLDLEELGLHDRIVGRGRARLRPGQ